MEYNYRPVILRETHRFVFHYFIKNFNIFILEFYITRKHVTSLHHRWTCFMLLGMYALRWICVIFFKLFYVRKLLLSSATVVAERLCFHKRLSFCPQGGVHAPPPTHTPWPGRQPLARRTPPPGRLPLQRTVRILLECILVVEIFLKLFKIQISQMSFK